MKLENWLIGESAVPKILVLNEIFKKKRLAMASEFYGRELKGYHPLLGHPSAYKSVSLEDILFLDNFEGRTNFREDKLKTLDENYKYLEYLLPFQEKQFNTSVNIEFFKAFPEGKGEFEKSLDLIKNSSPWMYKVFQAVNEEICPIKVKGKGRCFLSFTDYHVIGVIFCGLKPVPNNIFELALCLSHELAHNVLHLYQAGQSPIAEESYNDRVYSGIRKTDRPVFGSFHAAVALGYMVSLCRSYLINEKGGEYYEYASRKATEFENSLWEGLEALKGVKFNDLGHEIYVELCSITD